uniref:Putative secreted protein n=1 Tax=Rhipicephalus microplus TaxID=6941 RepID=A0A6M2D8P6_RHIMP
MRPCFCHACWILLLELGFSCLQPPKEQRKSGPELHHTISLLPHFFSQGRHSSAYHAHCAQGRTVFLPSQNTGAAVHFSILPCMKVIAESFQPIQRCLGWLHLYRTLGTRRGGSHGRQLYPLILHLYEGTSFDRQCTPTKDGFVMRYCFGHACWIHLTALGYLCLQQ